MSKTMKTILIGLSVFAAVLLAVMVIYLVQKPTTQKVTPSPTPTTTPAASPVVPDVSEVVPGQICALTFTVAEELVPGLNCVAKELYKNVSSNTAGTYDLTAANKLNSTHELVPGDTYVYAVSYENSGTGAIDGKIEDTLPTGLTYLDGVTGCSYVAATRKVTCTIASTAAGAEGVKAFRFKVNADIATDATVTNVAKVIPTTGDESSCNISNPVKTPPPSTSPSPSPSVSPSPSSTTQSSLECVVKRAYENDERNTAGSYYLTKEITDANTLSNGQIIVYNVVAANRGNAQVTGVTVEDTISANLTYMDASSGCNYNSSTKVVTCNIGTIPANTEASISIRVQIATASTTAINNKAEVFSTDGQRDICEITVSTTGKIVQPPSPIPSALPEAGILEVTTTTLGVGVLLLLLGTVGLLLL